MWLSLDLSTPEACEQCIEKSVSFLGGIDTLVNSAGVAYLMQTVANIQLNDLNHILFVNFQAPLLLMQKSYPYLKQSKGSVVNISSICKYLLENDDVTRNFIFHYAFFFFLAKFLDVNFNLANFYEWYILQYQHVYILLSNLLLDSCKARVSGPCRLLSEQGSARSVDKIGSTWVGPMSCACQFSEPWHSENEHSFELRVITRILRRRSWQFSQCISTRYHIWIVYMLRQWY